MKSVLLGTEDLLRRTEVEWWVSTVNLNSQSSGKHPCV